MAERLTGPVARSLRSARDVQRIQTRGVSIEPNKILDRGATRPLITRRDEA